MGVLKYLNTAEFKITKSTLLPQRFSSGPDSNAQASTSYYSKVAEVNERGELSGDETTQSCSSNNSSDEEEDIVVERIAKSEADTLLEEEEAENRCV